MTSARTHPLSVRFLLRHVGIAACFFLGSSMSFATVPLQENQTIPAPPTNDVLLGNDRPISPRPLGWVVTFERQRPCFWGENQEGLQRVDSEHDASEPSTFFCVRLAADAEELGWAGHEANGDHAKSMGDWRAAEKSYASAVDLLEQTADKNINQDLAALFNKLGITRFKQNDFAGAETVFRRALVIYTVTKGAEDLHVADTLDLVANALFEQQQGRILAGPLFYRAWAIREAMLMPDHPAIADSLHHLAVSLYSDNLLLAISMLIRSKNIREKVFGHDHPLVVNSLNAMAHLYEAHNRRDLAIPLYQDALTIQEKIFGPDASETLQARDYLAIAHREKDNLAGHPNAQR